MSFTLCLAAAACLVVVQCAPLNGEELIQNIERAASHEVQKAQSTASAMRMQADAEESQMNLNQDFAEKMGAEVTNDAKQLKIMEDEEKQSITDAKAIEADTQTSNLKDIEKRDIDAEHKSADIQIIAEKLDSSLLSAETKLKDVGIESQRAMKQAVKKAEAKASLGDSPEWDAEATEGSFKSQLQQTEENARTMVQQAQVEAKTQTSRKEELDHQMTKMSSIAKTGMQQLEKAETQLHGDLGNHKDLELEEDIKSQVHDPEEQPGEEPMHGQLPDRLDPNMANFDMTNPSKTALGESPLEDAITAAETSVAAKVPAEAMESTLAADTQMPPVGGEVPNFAANTQMPPVGGEVPNSATAAPSEPVGGEVPNFAANTQMPPVGGEVPNSATAAASDFMMPLEDRIMPSSAEGDPSVPLPAPAANQMDAIENDAEQLEANQKQAISEIKRIREPLM